MSAAELDKLRARPDVKALMDKTLKNLRFVEGGSFEMGDFGEKYGDEGLPYDRELDSKPLHKVTLTSFSISAYKTTYGDHDVFSAAMGKEKVGMDVVAKRARFAQAGAGLNWYQAREYCQWLGSLLKLPIDLPTEAQWEYAARGRGQRILFATDTGKVDEGRNVWGFDQRNDQAHKLNSGANPPSLPLGQFPPTPLGLYDVMTDGYEWVLDWYDPDYYKNSPETDPAGPTSGTLKVLRSHRGTSGGGLVYGDGFTIARKKREPDPPKVNPRTGKPDPFYANMTADTTARCVVNQSDPVTP
jgi:formylglycine-generating enzyme required for sulfatase activity